MSSTPNSAHQPFTMPVSHGLDPVVGSQLHHAERHTAERRPPDLPKSDVLPRWRAACAQVLFQRRPNPLPADHELFTGLDRREFARAGNLFDVVEVAPGQSLGEQGEPVDAFIAILEGQVGVTIDGVPHAVLDDGSHLGALALLDDARPTHRGTFSVMAASRIAVVRAKRFPSMLEELPTVAERIRAISDVRRAYLAGLAAATTNEPEATPSRPVRGYPVHLHDAHITPARRPVMQVRGRTSR